MEPAGERAGVVAVEVEVAGERFGDTEVEEVVEGTESCEVPEFEGFFAGSGGCAGALAVVDCEGEREGVLLAGEAGVGLRSGVSSAELSPCLSRRLWMNARRPQPSQ